MLFLQSTFVAALVALVNAIPRPQHQGASRDGGGKQIGQLVDLGYSQYRGQQVGPGVNQYLGMRFAAPPLGNLRFRAPADPVVNRTVQDAFEHGPLCYAVDAGIESGESEDCLFIDVFTPSNATEDSKLPVFLWIQGGGYIENSNGNYNGTTLVNHSGGNMIVVTFNYRVGPFGFLAGEEVRENGSLNAGLLDERKAMEWVKQHIVQFGGDPDHIVLVGVSAGAGSVAMQLLAYNGRNDSLFIGGIGDFAGAAGCGNSTNKLDCLRALPSTTLQSANVGFPFPGRTNAPHFPYSPCVDGDFLTDFPYKLYQEGKFVHVPIIFGDDQNEGTYFVTNASNPQNISDFFMDNYPHLTAQDTAAINSEYPLSANPPVAEHAEYFSAAAAAYGEATFNCPGIMIARSATQYSPDLAWSYRYDVLDPANVAAGLGVPHAFEVPAVFGTDSNAGGNGTSAYETTNAPVIPLVMDYWISFVRTLNPNTMKLAGAPVWEDFGSEERRLLFQTGGEAVMEVVNEKQGGRCEFWKGLSVVMEQ